MQAVRSSVWPKRVAKSSSIIVCLTGALGLAGWTFKIDLLRSILPGLPNMAASTALLFVLAGVGLWCAVPFNFTSEFQADSHTGRHLLRRLSKLLAGAVAALGALRLLAYIIGVDIGLDQLWLSRFAQPTVGRMSPATALNFVVLGLGLRAATVLHRLRLVQVLALCGGIIGWLGVSRYLFGGQPILPYAQMAVHTAIAFIFLSVGLLCLQHDRGIVGLLVSDGPGGTIARRLVPSALFIPLIIGWLALQGEHAGWFEVEAGMALFALTNLLVFGGLIWANALHLHNSDLHRRHTEAALRFSEERTRMIVETALDAVISITDTSMITEWSLQAEAIFGWTRQEAIGRSLAETIIPMRYRELHQKGMQSYLTTGIGPVLNKRIEISALRRNGQEFPVELAITPIRIGDEISFSAFVRDISERKRAERALRENQQLLEAIVENSTAVIYVKDLQGRYLLVNRQYSELFHIAKDAVIGKTDYDVFPKEVADAFRAMDQRVISLGRAVTGEETAPHDDGPHTYLSVKCPLLDGDGKPYAMFGISTDISDRKQAERKRQRQLAQLDLLNRTTRAIGERQDMQSILQVVVSTLEDNLPIDFGCICLCDEQRKVLTVASIGIKGVSLGEELGLTPGTVVNVDRNALSQCLLGRLVYEPDLLEMEFPFPQRLAKGGLRSMVVAPLLLESDVFGVLVATRRNKNGFNSDECEFLRQLSEHVALAARQAHLHTALQRAYEDLRQTQEAVMQQERLRAFGEMASGIAHDINNAISPVGMYAELLLDSEPNLSKRTRTGLEIIQRAASDVAQTIARLREFYRQRESQTELKPVNVNRLILQVVELTRVRWNDMPQQSGTVIKVVTELAPDPPLIAGIESELREALTNLIFNAVDAMPGGGTLTLRTRITEHEPSPNSVTPIQNFHVEVSDTGIGMDNETRMRCTEPFFSTKGERGTGLGLAMVYGSMRRHSADVEIESELGTGTTIRLSFPVPRAALTAPISPSEFRTIAAKLRILLVDDDPVLLKSLEDTLSNDGHDVETAAGGQLGIEAFRTALELKKPFSVVFTDLGMPYVDGRKVASEVKEIAPATTVILLTGWGQQLSDEGNIPPNVDRVLGKPPKLRELREVLILAERQVRMSDNKTGT